MPLYHRPNPLPTLPDLGRSGFFSKPVPFFRTGEFRGAPIVLDEPKTPESVRPSKWLTGLAIGSVLLSGLAFTLLLAGLVWDSPERNWFLGALCAAYLVGSFTTFRALWRRVKSWISLEEVQPRFEIPHRRVESFRGNTRRERFVPFSTNSTSDLELN